MRTFGNHTCSLVLATISLFILTAPAAADGVSEPSGAPSNLIVRDDGEGHVLSFGWAAAPFHRTADVVTDAHLIAVPGSPIRLLLWNETRSGEVVPYYAISLDGERVAAVRETSYEVKLRYDTFDPGVRTPSVEAPLAADDQTTLYVVQFVTQPLEEFRAAIESMGGSVHHYLAQHSHIVEMNSETHDQVAALPFVRWVGAYHPAYRLDENLLDGVVRPDAPGIKQRYHIQVVHEGRAQKEIVADRVRALGGVVDLLNPSGFLLDATLKPRQLLEVIRMNEVFFVDRWLPPQTYMNNVRIDGGADHVESVAGYTGAGVRGEVMDSGLMTTHQAFQGNPPIVHTCNSTDTWHGTAVYGINFGDGTGNASARGVVPDGQGFIASYYCVSDRYDHTMELVQAPYNAVYQTNSWGSCCTTAYGTAATEMDRMIFDSDLVILQAQANDGSRNSDVSAWAKNVVSVGGIRHFDTLSRGDDAWSFAGSIGPADDGRVKPDLSYWYDDILTTSNSGGTMTDFGGTSAATPETAAHFGLFFQMWADGLFGNEVNPGGTVFENRPHSSTAKAVMINTATQYAFSGTGHDLTRVHQGWGTADVEYLYDMRDKISVIDETTVLANLETADFLAFVDAGEPELRVTMVYTDPQGTTTSTQHRINDLTLKVTSPSQVVYWGNNGLLSGNWSTSGGSANTIDTVENVFIQNPEAGLWTVEVIASEINQDSHTETPELDADFALVLSGGYLSTCTAQGLITLDAPKYACTDQAAIRVVDCDLNTDDLVIETVTVTIDSTTEPGGETVLLTETGPVTADFRGTIDLSTADAAGTLHISEGDVVTATYIDADDGLGGTNVVVTVTAVVDCTAPQISNVLATNIEAQSATITFATDEPANGTVRYGTACGALTETASETGFQAGHSVDLVGLSANTTYFFAVDAEDEAGNGATDDNAGACFSFTTPDVPDYFTEEFLGDFDLENVTFTLIPDGSLSSYRACTESATVFPTDPTGGTMLSLSDDAFSAITLGGGETVSLYGTSYGTFYVGSNGYITFTAGDGAYDESLPGHFGLPRISAIFDDFNPSVGGTISWKQLADRAAVTWQNVPEFGTSNLNSFQIELFFDGTIRVTWLAVATTDGICGLSEGAGLPGVFIESDLSGYGLCDCLAVSPGTGMASSGPAGGPFTPLCASYTLTNSCGTPLDWTAVGTQAWLDVTPSGGNLGATSSTDVDVCINGTANSLSLGTHEGSAKVSNTTSGAVLMRDVTLEVLAFAPGVGDDTCHDAGGDLGTPCGSDADCGPSQVCGVKCRYLALTPPSAAVAGGVASSIKVTTSTGEFFAGPEQPLPNPPSTDLVGAALQCVPTEVAVPHTQIWSSGTLYLFGAAVVPGQSYEVRMCDAVGTSCSAALTVVTGKWGDVIAPFGGGGQPSFGDISSVVDKFRNLLSAPDAPRSDLVGSGNPGNPDVPNQQVDFSDISADVDSFRGLDFPFTTTSCP